MHHVARLVAALGAIFALTATTAHAQVESTNYQSRGASADAGFYWSDDCSYGSAYVYGGQNVSHVVRGAPVSSAYSYAYVWGYNWCTGDSFNGWGSVETASISGLNTARISVPVTLSSWSCHEDPTEPRGTVCAEAVLGTGNFVVDLIGTGEVNRGISMNQYSAGSYRSSSRTNGSWRAAEATGSLVIGGRDYIEGAVGAWGSIRNDTSSSHWFYRF